MTEVPKWSVEAFSIVGQELLSILSVLWGIWYKTVKWCVGYKIDRTGF